MQMALDNLEQPRPVPLLSMRGVHKRFGATNALDGVDLDVAAGQVLALLGENGAGKSTLMKVLAGVVQPDGGAMHLAGRRFEPRNPLHARRLGVCMIHQELSIASHLSVAENIFLGIEPRRLGVVRRRVMHQRCKEALAQLDHGDLNLHQQAGELPLALQQIVEIARALVSSADHDHPAVIVFDEPTSSLSRHDVERFFSVVRLLRDRGHGIIYISHFIEEALRIADRFLVLRDGSLAGTGDMAGKSAADIIHLMIGERPAALYQRSEHAPSATLLSFEGLAGDPLPLRASLEVRRGEVVGIAGLMGSGRTELLRAIFGLKEISRGKIRVGSNVGWASPAQRLEQGVGLLSEDRKREGLALSLSVAENMTLTRSRWLEILGLVLPSREAAAAQHWVESLSIRCRSPWQKVQELSGGNQQKVALARLLYHNVDLLLLDEPTRGIDVGSKAQIYRLIDDLALRGRAVLLVSSHLPELLGVCDRIAVMHRGMLGAARPAAQWTEQRLLLEATGSA